SVRHALGEMLSVFGFTVETYESADAFLRAIDQPPSGCVVADVRMPGTDGIELVRELGRRKGALPVVLISGHADVPMAVARVKERCQWRLTGSSRGRKTLSKNRWTTPNSSQRSTGHLRGRPSGSICRSRKRPSAGISRD